MKQEYVRDWMTEDVITVKKGTALPDAHQLMTIKKIRRLPVVDDHGKLAGIITLGDVRGAEASPATSLSIWELCPFEAITMGDDGLPVVDDQRKLVGIITESDIFRLVVANEWELQQQSA